MVEQILNLLTHKENGMTFANYLKSIGAEINDPTNPYEAARFKLKGKTCVIYYKESKGRFSYSDEFAKSIHEDWKKSKKEKQKSKLEKSYLKKVKDKKSTVLNFIIKNFRKSGTCTVCILPHNRYAPRRVAASDLIKLGWATEVGKTETGVNLIPTEKFKEIYENESANDPMIKAKEELYKILGNLKQDPEFVRFINIEYDGYFNIENLHTIEEARVAYKCIKQYRRVFLKEAKA